MTMSVEISLLETNRFILFMFPGDLEVGSAPFVEQDVHRGTLHIRGVQEVDAGQYSCVASSSAGTSTGTVTLEVGGETKLQLFHIKLTFLPHLHNGKSILYHSCFHSGSIVLRGTGRRNS